MICRIGAEKQAKDIRALSKFMARYLKDMSGGSGEHFVSLSEPPATPLSPISLRQIVSSSAVRAQHCPARATRSHAAQFCFAICGRGLLVRSFPALKKHGSLFTSTKTRNGI